MSINYNDYVLERRAFVLCAAHNAKNPTMAVTECHAMPFAIYFHCHLDLYVYVCVPRPVLCL